MLRAGFIGWRGMVGSVLMERMEACGDFEGLESVFFSTSDVGGRGPEVGGGAPLADAYDLDVLKSLPIIVTCQGGDYTSKMYPALREAGWTGYWVDAASTLRMADDSVIVLDPVNRDVIERGLADGIKTYCGGNCTVSLMLMALGGLFKQGLVQWLSSMTYQSASGAGAKNMRELVAQMRHLGLAAASVLDDPGSSALELDRRIGSELSNPELPVDHFGVPLAASLIPWIDRAVELGQSREEWKGYTETNKILGAVPSIPVDGLCVRVGSMRCHAQAFTVKLTREVPLDELTDIIGSANEWVRVVANSKEETLAHLTPAAVSGSLSVPVGRLRKMRMGEDYLTAFSVGDQLLWGAAEPVRRMLAVLREK